MDWCYKKAWSMEDGETPMILLEVVWKNHFGLWFYITKHDHEIWLGTTTAKHFKHPMGEIRAIK
jgi:hypothetical protein